MERLTKMQIAEQEKVRRELSESNLPRTEQDILTEELMLPSRDGVKLRTILYRPAEQRAFPTVVVRTSYPQEDHIYRAMAEEYCRAGFAYVYQYCRGVGGSEGTWEPNVHERVDGKSFIDWICEQDWVRNVGYLGNSYLALTGWCIADIVPEKVKTMYLTHYGTQRHTSAFMDGMFRHDILTAWTLRCAGKPIAADFYESCRYRPHKQVDTDLWGVSLDWYRDWICASDRTDPYWKHGFWNMLQNIPGRVKIPLFIGEGWFDHHLGSALETYQLLSEKSKKHSVFCIGGWDHRSNLCTAYHPNANARNTNRKNALEWFYRILVQGDIPNGRVEAYVIGSDTWISRDYKDNVTRKTDILYFSSKTGYQGAYQINETRQEEEIGLPYTYDPADPVFSNGAESLLFELDKIGSLIQPKALYRDDVISFISEPFQEEKTLFGRIRVHLNVSTDVDDTAFTVKVMEVTPEDNAYNIRTGITSLAYRNQSDTRLPYTPQEKVQIVIDTWDIAWTIHQGCRIRVDISSSDFPQYAIHPNFAGKWEEQTQERIAHQVIFTGGEQASYLELPIIEGFIRHSVASSR